MKTKIMTNKTGYNTIIQPAKFTQLFMRFSLVTPSKTRKLGYKKTITTKWGTITVSAVETPITRDLKVLVALVSYIQENPDRVKEFDIEDDKILSVDVEMYSFVRNYMHKTPSKELYDQIEESIRILSQMYLYGEYTIKHYNETITRKISLSILPKATIQEITIGSRQKKTIKILVYRWLVNMMLDPYTLFVDNFYLQKTGTRVSTLLCLFLMSQSQAKSYSKSFLVQQLGLEEIEENDNTMRELKNAFKDLQQIGYINSWSIERRKDDVYFIFSRSNQLKDKS